MPGAHRQTLGLQTFRGAVKAATLEARKLEHDRPLIPK